MRSFSPKVCFLKVTALLIQFIYYLLRLLFGFCLLYLLVLVICVFHEIFIFKYETYQYTFLHNIHVFSHLNNSFNEAYFMYHTIHPYIMCNSMWVWSGLFVFFFLLYLQSSSTRVITSFITFPQLRKKPTTH